MKPYLDDGDVTLYHGDAIAVLRELPAGTVQTCVTSPPYWGLRDYGTGTWTGGSADCDHRIDARPFQHGEGRQGNAFGTPPGGNASRTATYAGACGRCGAQRTDDQLGLEATPQEYVDRMVAVFAEVRRVLRDDGTLWLNLGDSYTSGSVDGGDRTTYAVDSNVARRGRARIPCRPQPGGLKPKDLVGIPWRVAFALQADGWYLRSDIVWSKPNPMPESVTDRPTKAHESVFLFAKSARYFYDADAIREAAVYGDHARTVDPRYHAPGQPEHAGLRRAGLDGGAATAGGRNRRSVWTIQAQPFPEAHFATYPEALVRPCILAGTSERGECGECGAPWRRQVEREADPFGRSSSDRDRNLPDRELESRRHRKVGQAYQNWRDEHPPQTSGWEPSCTCAAAATPQTVLDPFIGSGTTALVARKHGRRCIGIDLSAEYLAIAAKRTSQLSLLGGGS